MNIVHMYTVSKGGYGGIYVAFYNVCKLDKEWDLNQTWFNIGSDSPTTAGNTRPPLEK